MADGQTSSHPSVPRWDGDPGTIEDFAELTRYWVLGHKTEDRVYLGPRMLQVMDQKSQQYEEAKKVALETLVSANGAEAIVAALRTIRGPDSSQEAVKRTKEFWRGLRRTKGESMRGWTSRFKICVRRTGAAIKKVDDGVNPEQWLPSFMLGVMLLEGTMLDPSEEAAILATSGAGNSRALDDIVNSLCRQWNDDSIIKRDQRVYGKIASERGTGFATDDGSFGVQNAEFSSDELECAYEQGYRAGITASVAASSYSSEYLQPAIEDQETYYDDSFSGEPDAEYEQAEGVEQEAGDEVASNGVYALTAQEAQRTFSQARALLANLDKARGYFPVVGVGALPSLPSERPQRLEDRGRPRARGRAGGPSRGGSSGSFRGGGRGRDGGGRGRDGSRPGPARGGSRPQHRGANPDAMQVDFDGQCLLCGRYGHKAAFCPDRGKASSSVQKRSVAGIWGVFPDSYTFGHSLAEPEGQADASVAFNLAECRFLGLLDGGAASSVGGLGQLQELQDAGVPMVITQCLKGFTFAGGDRCEAHTMATFRVAALGGTEVSVYIIDRPSPILFGTDTLTKCGIVINYATEQVHLHGNGRIVPVQRLSQGHVGVSLVGPVLAGVAAVVQ